MEFARLKFLVPGGAAPDRPLFVFLPGMDGTGTLFQTQVDEMADMFDIRCLAIPPTDRTYWNGLVDQVIDLIQSELAPNPRPVYLYGESFGGCLALKIGARSPGLCDRLILANPASSFSRLFWLRWSGSVVESMSEAAYGLSTLGLMPLLMSPGRVARPQRQALLQASQSVPAPTAAWRLQLLKDFSLYNLPLAQLTQPTLVIASGCDRLLPSRSEAKRLVQALPQCQKVVLPHSGHACLLEREVSLYRILKEQQFLPE